MFNHVDGIMRDLAKKQGQWKEYLYFAVKFAWQKLSKYYPQVTPTTGMLCILACILDLVWMLRSLTMWDMGIDIHSEDETSFTTKFANAFLKYVEIQYCANHRHLHVIEPKCELSNNHFPSIMASRSGHSSFDQYDLSSNDEEYSIHGIVEETMPGLSENKVCLLTAAGLDLNSLHDQPKQWGKIIRMLMITTVTQWRIAVHLGHQILSNGAINKKKHTHRTLISLMWDAKCSPSYHMVWGCRSMFPLGKMWSAGGRQILQGRPFPNNLW